jgi:hypothetical protein
MEEIEHQKFGGGVRIKCARFRPGVAPMAYNLPLIRGLLKDGESLVKAVFELRRALLPIIVGGRWCLVSVFRTGKVTGKNGRFPATSEPRLSACFHSSHASAFTLVELLAVVGVIAVAVLVALPSITSLSRTSARNTAVSSLLSALDQARSLTLAQSSDHLLVLSDGNPAWPESDRFRAFAIVQEVYYPAHQSYRPVQVTPWTRLPSGVAFLPGENTIFAAPKMKLYCQPTGQEIEVAYFRFNQLGGVEEPFDVSHARVVLFDGFIGSGGEAVEPKMGGKAVRESIRVGTAGGRARREEPSAGG